jgi:hypothetical protein
MGAGDQSSREYTLGPIPVGAPGVKDGGVIQLAIRCHPCVPLSIEELEQWLQSEVHELRAEAPQATIRLSRLTQGLPSVTLDIGWLVELELSEDEPLLAGERLAEAIRDMRMVGLQPTLLAAAPRKRPPPRTSHSNGAR